MTRPASGASRSPSGAGPRRKRARRSRRSRGRAGRPRVPIRRSGRCAAGAARRPSAGRGARTSAARRPAARRGPGCTAPMAAAATRTVEALDVSAGSVRQAATRTGAAGRAWAPDTFGRCCGSGASVAAEPKRACSPGVTTATAQFCSTRPAGRPLGGVSAVGSRPAASRAVVDGRPRLAGNPRGHGPQPAGRLGRRARLAGCLARRHPAGRALAVAHPCRG